MKYLIGVFLILMISQIYACESGQIDVNSASLARLDELNGIGPVKAQAIIDARSFDSIEDLIKVYGIGPATLQKIKDQNLACVEEENIENVENEINHEQSSDSFFPEEIEKPLSNQKENIKLEVITLNSLDTKDIKSEDDKKNLDKSDWAKYGFVGFCVLLGFLFILKKRKVRDKFD